MKAIKEFSEKDVFLLLESFNKLSKKEKNLLLSRDQFKNPYLYGGFCSWIRGQKTMWKIYDDTNMVE
jgi:hypothetical protein